MNIDVRKYRCGKGKCTADIPEVVCERVMIMRREIPHFVALMDMLGDALLSYRIIHPKPEKGKDPDAFDRTWIYIWVDPHKHIDPDYLVKASANVACGSFSMEQEKDFIRETFEDGSYQNTSRELNCPVCKKNYRYLDSCAMTSHDYHARIGVHH